MHVHSKDTAGAAACAPLSAWSAAKAALAAAVSDGAAWFARSWLGKLVSASLREREARLAIAELKTWDDHMLRDIGLERTRIEPAVRGAFRPLPLDADAAPKPPHPRV